MTSHEIRVPRRWRNLPPRRDRDAHRARRLWGFWLLMLSAAVPVALYLVCGGLYLQSQYRIEELRLQQERLAEMEQRLLLRRAALESPERVERVAHRRLGLIRPDMADVVVVRATPGEHGDWMARVPRRR